jgi:hypothetical protein
MIRENLKVTQSRQKSYVDKRRDLLFKTGDLIYLKVSPMRGTRRFKVKGKLGPRYVGPFKIVDRMGEVAYQLELPPQLSDVQMYCMCHNTTNACESLRSPWKSLT